MAPLGEKLKHEKNEPIWWVPRWILLLAFLFSLGIFLIGFCLPIVRIVVLPWINFSPELPLVRQALGQGVLNLWTEWAPVMGVTALQAILSTGLAGILGIGLGGCIGEWLRGSSVQRRELISSGFLIPFLVPTMVVIQAFLFFTGNQSVWVRSGLGSVGASFGWSAVIFVHVVMSVTWIAGIVAQSIWDVPQSALELLRTLGANRVNIFRLLHYRYLKIPIALALTQVFCLCATSFSVITILGGGPPVETLETAIYSKVRLGVIDQRGAAFGALLQLGLTLPLQWFVLSRSQKTLVGMREFKNSKMNVTQSFSALSALFNGGLAILIALQGFSFLTDSELGEALLGSLLLSGSASVLTIACLISVLMVGVHLRLIGRADHPWWRLFMLPSGGSILVLCLGLWLVLGDRMPWGSLILVQTVMFLPYVLRMSIPLTLTVDQNALELVRTLGGTQWKSFWVVEGPRWKTMIWRCAKVVFVFAMGEFAAISFFSTGTWSTLTLTQSKLISQYRFQEADDIAIFFVLITLFLFGVKWPRLFRSTLK